MAELTNSKRSLLQATYTPIRRPQETGGSSSAPIRAVGRAWEKWGFVASLKPSWNEIGELKGRFQEALNRGGTDIDRSRMQRTLNAIGVIQSAIPQEGTPDALRSVTLFRDLDPDSLVEFASGLIKLRQEQIGAATKAHKLISESFDKAQSLQGTQKIGEKAPKVNVPSKQENAAITSPLKSLTTNVKTLMDWAIQNGTQTDAAALTLHLAENLSFRLDSMTLRDFGTLSQGYIDHLIAAADGFTRRMAIEPVGFLHLERLGFTPVGIERGELIHSVPLAPGEEVNIAHKEWSNTSEEFEKIVTDYMEAYSEEGVAEKSELAQSTNSQNQHSSGLNTGVTASGSYGPVSVTASLDYHIADSASHSEQTSRKQSMDNTKKASSRTKKEHKITFKVASAAGTEDQAIRKITNPFPDRATRVDYYQLVRKWKVDLYRYGVRLTYDITIPEPGADIIYKLKRINEINGELERGFEFPVQLAEITPETYNEKAAEYGATIAEFPKQRRVEKDYVDHHTWASAATYGNAYRTELWVFEFEIDEGYYISGARIFADPYPVFPEARDNAPDLTYLTQNSDLIGRSGKVAVVYQTAGLSDLVVHVAVTLELQPEVYEAWQLKTWSNIRDAAQGHYEENRQMLKDELARLQQELGAQDALSLRKIEREEVMKGVLRWLFGPTFEFVPVTVSDNRLYNDNEVVVSEFIWDRVMNYGEIIKFLHHAIEWENMLYFLYPYFWSHISRWDLKKYLDHPDPMHRVFLKSGSVRVVLTIRPGFEEAFTSFIEQGSSFLDVLAPGHPYVTVAEEMKNYTETNYPGIRAANPVEDARPLIYPKQRKAWDDMQIIMKLLNAYFTANGTYPPALTDLRSMLPYSYGTSPTITITDVPMRDPWGNNYVYTYPGVYNFEKYDLVSYGADGAQGGDDENADITSWAEASLIGTWFEYTPTSALDIAFDETAPEA